MWTTEEVPHPPRYKRKTNSGFYSNTQLSLSLSFSLSTNGMLTSNNLCASPRCLAQFIAPIGWWLQEGIYVGERELQWSARRCGRISRCGQPYDLHCLWSSVCDLFVEAVRRWLWVGLLWEGGAVGSLGASGPGPSCHTLRSMLFCVDEVLAVAQSRLITGLWVHGSKWG
jgi:hypothetical protein